MCFSTVRGRDFQLFGDLSDTFVIETIHDENLLTLRGKLTDCLFNMFLKF